jgi:hypothetical protein
MRMHCLTGRSEEGLEANGVRSAPCPLQHVAGWCPWNKRLRRPWHWAIRFGDILNGSWLVRQIAISSMLSVCSAHATVLTSPGAAYDLSFRAPSFPELQNLGTLESSI